MQDHYISEDHTAVVQVISKFFCHQSEEEAGQTIYKFLIDHEEFWSRKVSFQTSYIWQSYAIKDLKSYLCHNLYAIKITKVLRLVGFRVTSKFLGIGPSERNWKENKHVQCGQRSCL